MTTHANDFTHAGLGVLLIAVGTQMVEHNLCAGAAMDGSSDSSLFDIMMKTGQVTEEEARALCGVDLAEAIEVVHLDYVYEPTMSDFHCTADE